MTSGRAWCGDEVNLRTASPRVMAGLKREARLRVRPGHPRLSCRASVKTWMPGTRPGMTGRGYVLCRYGDSAALNCERLRVVCRPPHASWPGSSRPSTSFLPRVSEDVDARHKAGHDGERTRDCRYGFSAASTKQPPGLPTIAFDTHTSTRHGRACPGDPRLSCRESVKTWMPGTRPGMTCGEVACSSIRRLRSVYCVMVG
jgi:hypothetical protein